MHTPSQNLLLYFSVHWKKTTKLTSSDEAWQSGELTMFLEIFSSRAVLLINVDIATVLWHFSVSWQGLRKVNNVCFLNYEVQVTIRSLHGDAEMAAKTVILYQTSPCCAFFCPTTSHWLGSRGEISTNGKGRRFSPKTPSCYTLPTFPSCYWEACFPQEQHWEGREFPFLPMEISGRSKPSFGSAGKHLMMPQQSKHCTLQRKRKTLNRGSVFGSIP